MRAWPLILVSLPHPAPEILALCLGATPLCSPSVLAPFSLGLECDGLNCLALSGCRGKRWENALMY